MPSSCRAPRCDHDARRRADDFEAACKAVRLHFAIDATHRSFGHRFKARVEEVQQIDVVEAVFEGRGAAPLDLEKMAILGKEAAVVGVAAIAGAFLLLFSSLFFTQSKKPPLKEQPVENTDPGVCLSGKCANGAKSVKAWSSRPTASPTTATRRARKTRSRSSSNYVRFVKRRARAP